MPAPRAGSSTTWLALQSAQRPARADCKQRATGVADRRSRAQGRIDRRGLGSSASGRPVQPRPPRGVVEDLDHRPSRQDQPSRLAPPQGRWFCSLPPARGSRNPGSSGAVGPAPDRRERPESEGITRTSDFVIVARRERECHLAELVRWAQRMTPLRSSLAENGERHRRQRRRRRLRPGVAILARRERRAPPCWCCRPPA
jgi:hypothetical protein